MCKERDTKGIVTLYEGHTMNEKEKKDITDDKLSFMEFTNVAKQFDECMNDYLFVYDIDNDSYHISKRAVERFRVPASLFSDVLEAHHHFVYKDDIDMIVEELQKLIAGIKDEHDLEYRWLDRDGNPVWINCRGKIQRRTEETPLILYGCINEIGERQKADNVSGMLDEVAFRQMFELGNAAPPGFVLRVGIDDLQDISEQYDLKKSNEIIRDFSECIRRSLNENQRSFHTQNDEFFIVDIGDGNLQDAKILYRMIHMQVDQMLQRINYSYVYTVSAGAMQKPTHIKDAEDVDLEQLVRKSEFALEMARQNGKNQLYVYDEHDYVQFVNQKSLKAEMVKAVANDFDGFFICVQPLIEVKTRQLHGGEALLRFQRADGRIVSPSEFVPILEESGLIIPIGRWVLRQACDICREMRERYENFQISVNMSYVQILKSPIIEDIMYMIRMAEIDPDGLVIELTESGHLENTIAVQSVWCKLKEQGVYLAIDDFGTGYSNLQSIANLKPDIVKVDRIFTMKALNNEYERNLMLYIIQMVHSLGLTLVVEGVETEEDLNEITTMDPDYIQGYYFSRPLPKYDFYKRYLFVEKEEEKE